MAHINDVVFEKLSAAYGVQPMTELLRLFWLDHGGHPCNELFNFYKGAGAVGEHVLDLQFDYFNRVFGGVVVGFRLLQETGFALLSELSDVLRVE